MIYEDGEQTRDFSFVEDIARANFLAATSDQLDGKAVNVGSGRAVTIKQVAEMISEALQIRLAPIMNRELELVTGRCTSPQVKVLHCLTDESPEQKLF